MLWLFLSLTFVIESFGSNVPYLEDYDPVGAFCDFKKNYSYYRICYSHEHRQSLWTLHMLTLKNIQGSTQRTNDYKEDLDITNAVGPKDYRFSGYDRGHLVPAADMKLNFISMTETFYMTNMSPQNSRFNSGIWRQLETHLRKLVKTSGDAWVITAPVITRADPTIDSGVTVPRKFLKVIYFEKASYMLAYIIPNKDPQKDKKLKDYKYTVDEAEKLTGLDFFSSLNHDLEEKLEKTD